MMNPIANLESLYPYFDNLAEGIAVLDREGKVVSMNGAAARLLGVAGPRDAEGWFEELADAFTSAGERIPPEERPGRLAVRGRYVRNFEAALWPQGAAEASFVEISTAPLPGPNGETEYILVSYREITGRKRLDESRARLAAIVESSEDAIIGKDLSGVVTAWNRGAEKLFGYSAEEMIGQSIRRLLLPGDEAEEDEILRCIARGEIVQHAERKRKTRNGEVIEVSVTISPIRNSRGEVVGASKIARDITESRRAADALHESQQRLTGIISSAMDAIITVDEQQNVILFNAAAERMFLCSQAGALGKPIDQFLPERFRALHTRHIRRFGETGMTSRAMGELGSLWALRSNGEEFEIEASISQVESHGRKLYTVIMRDITDRKRAKESLREQAQLMRISQTIARDMESRIVFWSEGAEKMYGFSQDEALGAISHELFQTQFPVPLEAIEEQLHRTGRWEGALIHRKRDGSSIFVSAAWILDRDLEGNPCRILESLVDITARKQADEKLRAQAEELARSRRELEEKTLMLQSVLDSMSEGLVAVDEQGRFILWNPAAAKIVGMGPSELGPKAWNEHYGVYREDGVTPLPADQNPLAIAASGEVNSTVILVRNQNIPDGAYLEIYASPLRDKTGKLRGGVTAFRDITSRRRAQQQAFQSEEKFSKAFKSSPIAMAITTASEGRYIDVNPSLLKLIGFDSGEVVGRTFAELGVWADAGERDRKLKELRREGSIRPFESLFRTKTGEARTVNVCMEPVMLDGAECILTTATDVTETRKLERQLQQSQKMEALGQLTGGIAHDFNNLLGVIVGNLDLLERIVAWNDEAMKRVHAAGRAAGRGAELTRRLLAFSRREQLNPAPVGIENAIRDVVELATRTLGPEIKLSTRCDANLPPAFVDAGSLETALLNLALNARDAMPKGGSLMLTAHLADLTGSNPLVQAGELEPGKYVRIAVSDSGHGMSRETMERAFEPFFTTKPREKGTGLGLAMVYGFVKQSGGAIRLYSEVGYGTTVSIFLPLASEPAQNLPVAEPGHKPERLGGTALVVDDEADLLEVADAYLAELGYTVLRAGDGEAALDAIERAGDVDLMVTDIIMPGGMNGIELARRVRELHPEIKIIFTSGFPAEALAERSAALEGGPLLHKPYLRAEFADMVRRSMSANTNGV
jgi:PAS domain S-box-containing protein